MKIPHQTDHTPAGSLSPLDVERQFRDSHRRTRRHWYEDGLAEVAVGAVFLACGAYFAAEAFVAGRSGLVGHVVVNLLLPAIVIGAGLGVRGLIRRAKEHFVYPRTGFVTYPRKRRLPRWLVGAVAGVIAGVTAALVRRASPGIDAWIPAIQGFLVAAFFVWLGLAADVPRLTLLGLLSALTGVLVSLLCPVSPVAGAAFFGIVGVAMLVTGGVTFRGFVRRVPPAEEP